MGTLVWRRWVVRGLVGAGGLLAAVVVAALVLLRSLDRPWIKSRVQGIARTSGGVDVDYRGARIAWLSGLDIEGLVVQSPSELRRFAPELVHVDHIAVHWTLGGLLLGHGPAIQRAAIAGITLTVVMDEKGRTSFDALSSSPKAPPEPAVPLSHQASKYLGAALPLGEFAVDDVTLNLVRTDHGETSERTQLRGLGLVLSTGSAEPEAKGSRVHVELGSAASPLDLQVMRAPVGATATSARAKLSLTVDVTGAALHAVFDLRMLEQTFAASVSADHWLHADANAHFDPAAGLTELTLAHLEAGDGAVTAEASAQIPDAGDPTVRRAHGEIDLARLLGWLPAGLVPVTAERAHASARVESLVAGPTPHLSGGGSASLDAALTNVDVASAGATAHVTSAELSVSAQPAPGGGIAGRASLKIAALGAAAGPDRVDAQDLAVDADGAHGLDGVLAGRVEFRFAKVVRAGSVPIVAKDGHVELRAQGLHLDPDAPLATRGDLTLSADVASLDARPGARITVDGLSLSVHTALEGHAPYAAEIEARMSRLRAFGRDGALLADAPTRIAIRAKDVQPDLANPMASRAELHAALDLGETKTTLDATKAADAVDFALRIATPNLKLARPFLPPSVVNRAPWDRMAVSLESKGHAERLAGDNPFVRQTTEVRVTPLAFSGVEARSIAVSLESQGSALEQQIDVDLHALGLALDAGRPSDDHVTLSAHVDRMHPSLQFQVATEGRAATKLAGAFAFDPSRRAVTYGLDGHLAGLAPIAPFAASIHGLDAVDVSQLEVTFAAHGSVLGVVAGVTPDGAVRLEPNPALTAGVEGTADLDVTHLHWARGDDAVIAPEVKWHADMHAAGARRALDSRLEIGAVHLDIGSHDVDLSGIRDTANVTVTGNLAAPSDTQITQQLSIHGVTQDFAPEYPVGDLDFSLSAERGPEGVVHVSDLKVTNALAGTSLGMTGNVAVGEGRRTLSVATSLTQDLARLSTLPERFKGKGNVVVEANVTSPDYASHCDVRASVKGTDVSVTLPRDGIEVDTFNGEVPITAALDLAGGGVTLQQGEKRSPYSMLRFTDQHPLLTRSGFLSIDRIKTPWISIAPLVGNLEVEQNAISLRQFEMGVRGGTITGQCGVVWAGTKSTLELHVRASGVQSSHGEPFDGNIEVAISVADRTIEGRAEILRIGERHLLDLLDLQDPLHVDPTMNRVRMGLKFGYPDHVRLIFDHGFASVHIELGGVARLFSIGEMRGIPMGPIVDKMLSPVLDAPGTKETP
jgi:translocation and assembly module TamB